ncbi:MAG TPA: hypothetical protein VGM82_21935 [Gemmatimonadaceae bacterium]|jgi:hypothetical protein
MRSRVATLSALIALPIAAARAQSTPCGQSCSIVFDWGSGGTQPDIDRIYGAPSSMESAFAKALSDAGWNVVDTTSNASLIITVRPVVQNRVRCDTMGGTNVDMSCHAATRGVAVFVSNDTSLKAPSRVEIIPRCSDPLAYPTFAQFGEFAGQMVVFQVAGGKGARPTIKCRL